MKGDILQDEVLEEMKKTKVLITIYLPDELQIKGIVREFDEHVIFLEFEDKQQMVYRKFISLIRPMKSLDFKLGEEKMGTV
ncbi:MAG: RNA chaperone Hfq [Clostridiales bacterium]|nr:RNA chaperone Hfq [Clostridiales bacterium]